MRVVWSERLWNHQLVESVPTDATLGAYVLPHRLAAQRNDWLGHGLTARRACPRSHVWLRATVLAMLGLLAATQNLLSQTTVARLLKKSANGRYLVDQNNVPFLIAGDSPQSLTVNVSTNDADMYLANRQLRGFNALWVNLLCNDGTAGRADGSTYDGILPFNGYLAGHAGDPNYYDLATPNPTFFARCDWMINQAAKYGLVVWLNPIETIGWLRNNGSNGVLLNNGTNACRAYGQFLGNRYKDFTNIVWMSGSDFQNWTTPAADAVVRAVALGIKDTDPNHIHTVQLDYPTSGSLNDTNWVPIISLNASYTYYPTYAQVLNDYNRTNFLPVFLVEANYEFEGLFSAPVTTAPILRRQEYWANLSGATGQFYGSYYSWRFASGWQNFLDSPGALQMPHVKALFEPRAWYNLVPDQTHSVLTAGHGTYATTGFVADNDYAVAARTPDGRLVIVYMPTLRTITVDMGKLAAPAVARWYDPSNGSYLSIAGSPFPNTGTRNFTPPGSNHDGDGGWVLVLEADSPVDSVGDGIPNWWRAKYWPQFDAASTNNSTCATCDADGTGQNNLFKYVAGLAPTDPASVFVLKIHPVSGAPNQKSLIYEPITSGRLYTVQSVTDLADGDWSLQVTSAPQTNGTQVTVTDQNATGNSKFYRVAIALVAPDSVGDGIPDVWRAQYFAGFDPSGTTTGTLSCATCDADWTGQNNLFKYVTGLDPTNPASVFVLKIASVDGQPNQKNLFFGPLASGRTYTPQFTSNLVGAVWSKLSTIAGPTTNGNQAAVTDLDATTPRKFYRIYISQP
jgi:hypothetical protein